MQNNTIIKTTGLTKRFGLSKNNILAVDNLDIEVHRGEIWIHHPALRDAREEDLEHLGERISGKFTHDKLGHFRAVAAVMLGESRFLLSKYGRLVPQFRFFFVSNPRATPSLYEKFPYLSWFWWGEAESHVLPARDIFGKRIWISPLASQSKTGPQELFETNIK